MKKKKIVFVGISGGVDSAVSAALLKEQGYDVVGVFIRTWHPDFLDCNEEEERHDAIRICAHLNVPFLTFDLEDVYKKEVADYMIREYKAGRTPNPDVMCNKHVKFGAFFKKAIDMGANYIATGHYAQVKNSKNSCAFALRKDRKGDRHFKFLNFLLLKGVDPTKDQSYFLWTLKQEQLGKIFFPIGYLKKTEVRKLAKKFKLPVADKKDSQGICFLGQVDLKEFLKHYIKEKKGKVVNAEGPEDSRGKKGKEIGYHDGVLFYTLGERHGFTITKKSSNDGPYYVVGKDIKKNILYVSQNYKKLSKEDFLIILKNTNWISETPKENKNYTMQIRYHGEFLSCKIKITSKNNVKVILQKPILVAAGQSCVIYDGDICLGGGIII